MKDLSYCPCLLYGQSCVSLLAGVSPLGNLCSSIKLGITRRKQRELLGPHLSLRRASCPICSLACGARSGLCPRNVSLGAGEKRWRAEGSFNARKSPLAFWQDLGPGLPWDSMEHGPTSVVTGPSGPEVFHTTARPLPPMLLKVEKSLLQEPGPWGSPSPEASGARSAAGGWPESSKHDASFPNPARGSVLHLPPLQTWGLHTRVQWTSLELAPLRVGFCC